MPLLKDTEHRLLAERIQQLITQLCQGLYERGDAMRLCLLATLAGESVFLLGPPGIAKSMLARRIISAFDGGASFEYLMTRFSTPEEVFGPLSIQALKDEGRYQRLTEGYLPEADVVFLDEIWKASPAILNTLLTVINEKLFKNGHQLHKVPMKLLITASNELPEQDASLDALYDRLLIRIYLGRIEERTNFKAMITCEGAGLHSVDSRLKIRASEYQQWQAQIDQVTLSDPMFDKLYRLKSEMEKMANASDDPEQKRCLYISDRRWKKSVRLLKTSAFFNGRNVIDATDLLLLRDCLWRDLASRQIIYPLFERYGTEDAFEQVAIAAQLHSIDADLTSLLDELKQQLVARFTAEPPLGLRKKSSYNYPFHLAEQFHFAGKHGLIKLVYLAPNQAITEHPLEAGVWAYASAHHLGHKIQNGRGEIAGYLNGRQKMQPLRFEIINNQLMGKDIANHSIPVAIVSQEKPDARLFEQWQNRLDELSQRLIPVDSNFKHTLRQFASASQNQFINHSLLDKIEAHFSQLSEQSAALAERLIQTQTLYQGLKNAWSDSLQSVWN